MSSDGLTYDTGALVAAERDDRIMWSLHRAALRRGVPVTAFATTDGELHRSLHRSGHDGRENPSRRPMASSSSRRRENGKKANSGEQRVSVERNIAMIEQLFAAFSRGDIESVLAALTDDVDWQGPVSEHAESLPWAGCRRGREQVADYFRAFAAASRWHPMEDVTFTAAGDRVVVEGRNRNEARATGRTYEHQWVMLFTIRDGQIARFRHYYDPADITHALD